MGHVENKAIYFTVNDPPETLNVQINANSTNINEKEDIRFNAEVTGSTGNVNYKWDFGNDGSVDSTSSSIVKKYNSNGTYQIKLTVVDDIDESSALETITVKKLFDVEITVKNETGSVIEKADIEFNGEHKNTSSSGKASFKINEGTYELKVEKEKYFDYVNGSVEINSNKNILVKLEYDDTDDSDPEIIIVSPGKNKEFQSSTVTITYKVNDNSKVNCTLQINEQGNWWTDKETHTNPDKNKEKQFTINNLNDGEYQYRIKCIDSGKNYGFSETRKFYVNIPEASATSSKSSGSNTDDVIENEQIESLLMRIEQVSSELEKLPKNEKDVIEIMKINEKIEDARKKLRWYERDLSNLVWRKLDDAELKKEEENIYQKIEDLKNEIPARLEVTDSNEFVAYPSEEDVQEIISKYLDSEPNSYSERTKNSIAKKNNKIQKLLTVTTKAMVVNIEYLSGQKGKITLVEKSIELDKISDDYSDNMFLIEYIPKEIAENTNQIEFLFDYDTIIEDPLIKITNKDITSFAYYINKDIQVEEIKKTKTLIVDDDSENSGNSITGFSIFTDIKPALIETGNTRLIIEIIIIIVLLVIYLGYSVKNPKIKYYLFNRNSIKKIDEIKEKIEKAKNKLTDGNYDDAKSIYSEIQSAFKEIPYDLRKEVYADIMLLSNKIDLFYINNLIDDANESLDDGNVKKAIEKYNKVRQLYVNLGPKFKEEIIRKCKKLVSRISNKNEK
jgi:PKD repeat protein